MAQTGREAKAAVWWNLVLKNGIVALLIQEGVCALEQGLFAFEMGLLLLQSRRACLRERRACFALETGVCC